MSLYRESQRGSIKYENDLISNVPMVLVCREVRPGLSPCFGISNRSGLDAACEYLEVRSNKDFKHFVLLRVGDRLELLMSDVVRI